jgi:hypothetical protein
MIGIVLEGLYKFAVAYLYDISIYSNTLEEHFKHMQEVLDRLRQHNLKIKLKRCSFHHLIYVIRNK